MADFFKSPTFRWLAGCLLAVIFFSHYPVSSQDWAAWIQAVGAIAAIIGAYWFGERQAAASLRIAKDMRAADLEDRRSSLKAILDDAFSLCLEVEQPLRDGGTIGNIAFWHISPDNLDERAAILTQLPLFELDSGKLVSGVLALSRAITSLAKMLETFKDLRAKKLAFEVSEEHLAAFLRDDVERARLAYRECLKVTGGDEIKRPARNLLDAVVNNL